MEKEQICKQIAESLDGLPIDVLRLIYKIILYAESGLE